MELYTFSIINDKNNDSLNEHYYYNNTNEDFYDITDDITYISKYVERDELNLNFGEDGFKIITDLFAEPFNKINSFILNKNLQVKVVSFEKKTVIFFGNIINYEMDVITKKLTLYCNNISNLLEQKAPTRKYSPSCPFALYERDCALDKTVYEDNINVVDLSISQDLKTITTNNNFDNEKFNGGIIDINDGEQRSHILSNNTTELILFYPIVIDINKWNSVKLYPGCNKNLDDCENKFNNIINFGGYPFIPTQNITQGF